MTLFVLAIFGHSNGKFPEGQLTTHLLPSTECREKDLRSPRQRQKPTTSRHRDRPERRGTNRPLLDGKTHGLRTLNHSLVIVMLRLTLFVVILEMIDYPVAHFDLVLK